MPTDDASLRQDLIENGVQRELISVEEAVAIDHEATFDGGLKNNLTTWPREYLETFLDSDDQGRIPLNEEGLQDVLEASVDRNEQIVRSFQQQLKETVARRTNERDNPRTPTSSNDKSNEHSGSFEAAQAQANSVLGPWTETRFPLTENGIYVGSIISETVEYLIQRISGTTAIAHPKSLFSDLPRIGQIVRIAYDKEKVAVREIATRQPSRELER